MTMSFMQRLRRRPRPAAAPVVVAADPHAELRARRDALVVFFLGFMTSSALWCLACAGAIAVLRSTVPTSVVRFIKLACGAALLTFAALLLHGLAS
jgi:arginine exporter protein ArgO